MAITTPNTGRQEMVRVGDIPLQLVYDLESGETAYQVREPERFGQPTSEGEPKYSSYSPHESASVASNFSGTYGLRDYSDADERDREAVLESDNIDVSLGKGIVSLKRTSETLPGATGRVVWIGEWMAADGVRRLYAIAGTRIFYRNSDGTWTIVAATLSATPRYQAVGVFNRKLIVGHGDSATAEYVSDTSVVAPVKLLDATLTQIYVWALTTDRASVYIAGGASGGEWYNVRASTDGINYGAATACGSTDSAITALAPGGGLGLVYVGKYTEIGLIDNTGVYRVLIPFDTVDQAYNGTLLQWWLGRSDDEQRGPLALFFVRDHHLWLFIPASESTGEAQDVTPWADTIRRPPNIFGVPIAMLGTTRWLYYVIRSSTEEVWLLRRDVRTGNTTVWQSLGTADSVAMTSTVLFDVRPILVLGVDDGIQTIVLPANTDWPLGDAEMRYQTGTLFASLSFPTMDLGLPDEDKSLLEVRVIADNLADGLREIQVLYSADDDDDYSVLGLAIESPRSAIPFDDTDDVAVCRRIALKTLWTNLDATQTPVLRAIVLRWALHPKSYRIWEFTAMIPAGRTGLPGTLLDNPERVIEALWAMRREGTPVTFIDRWRREHRVLMQDVREMAAGEPRSRAVETRVQLRLLETVGEPPPTVYTTYRLLADTSAWFPIVFPWPLFGSGRLSVSDTATNSLSTTTYPRWQVDGPLSSITIANNTTGETFTIEEDIGHGNGLEINTNPAKQIVRTFDGQDLFSELVGDLWGLGPGTTAFTITVEGASQSTVVTMIRRE